MQAYKNLGGYIRNPAFSAFHELSSKAFALFHGASETAERERPFVDLIVRMMYVAEATSSALRINGSWALSHPTFSLCRDRYEQCVRVSWLARQTDSREWYRYIADLYLTRSRLQEGARKWTDELADKFDNADYESLPPDLKKRFKYWRNRPLDQMASSRDGLEGITSSKIDNEPLAPMYESVYRQGSSVSHYDLYSISMLGLHKGPDGLVLAPDPYLPIVIVMHNALFDIIQVAEASEKLERPISKEILNQLHSDWWEFTRKTGILDKS